MVATIEILSDDLSSGLMIVIPGVFFNLLSGNLIVEIVCLTFVCKHGIKTYFWSVYDLVNEKYRQELFNRFYFQQFLKIRWKHWGSYNTAFLSFFLPYFPPTFSSLYPHHQFVFLFWHNSKRYSKHDPRLRREIPIWNFMKKSIGTHFMWKRKSYRKTFGFRCATVLNGFIIILVLL